MARTVLLQGPPGSGKTVMVCETAVNKPVHVIDVDWKIESLARFESLLASKQLTVDVVNESILEGSLYTNLDEMSDNNKPGKKPKGFIKFSDLVGKFETNPNVQAAGTILLDSWTNLVEHMKRLIIFEDPKGISTLSMRNWGTLSNMQTATMKTLIKFCKESGKDFMVTVHERAGELPLENTKVIKSIGKEGVTREYIGAMQVKMFPSIDGGYKEVMAKDFDEVYGLRVDVVNNEPKWICRVQPDGKRDLRTSFLVDKAEFPPDFKQIWKNVRKA